MDTHMSDSPVPFLTPAATTLLLLFYLNQRWASPLLAIAIRWLRWAVFSLFAAETALRFEWVDRPFWVTAGAAMLIWLLLESVFNWLRVSAISQSPFPLFPQFTSNTAGDEWPVQPRFVRLREWLRAHQFSPVQALKADVGGGVWLRVSIYQSADHLHRLQITFLPQPGGNITVCYSLSSEGADGRRWVTDNFYLPFGGFYPENWLVERRPWTRRLSRMLSRHQKRLARSGANLVPWETPPLEDLNRQQQQMDQLNIEMGFLLPHAEREEHGKITPEGRYRVWMESWLLSYLGWTRRY